MPPSPATLSEIRLPAFKSVRSATLPLRPMTLLVGRNGSGKSNVLDGIRVLSHLAAGGDIRDRIGGDGDGLALRGGVEGCAPLGSDRFELGCTVDTPAGSYLLDVAVRVRPVVQLVQERLRFEPPPPGGELRTLLEAEPPDPGAATVRARWGAGEDPGDGTFRASSLLTSQVFERVPATTESARRLHEAARAGLDALGAVFRLDPSPALMRRYVPAGDDRLQRRAGNLSAVLGRLLDHPPSREKLLAMVRGLSDTRVVSMATERSALGDVMLVQRELVGGREATVPARLMSDGTLRMLAVVAALLEGSEDTGAAPALPWASTTLVIEDVENGLHPSQAASLVQWIVEASSEQGLHTLATTHSPAMLDALRGEDHRGVVVCARDDQGWTRLSRLTELPNYFSVVAGGGLGGAAVHDRLRPAPGTRSAAELVDELLGGR